jgi:hypothetical protein
MIRTMKISICWMQDWNNANSNIFGSWSNDTKTQIMKCNMNIKQCVTYTSLKLTWQNWLYNFAKFENMTSKHKHNKFSWQIWWDNFTICQNMIDKHKHINCFDKFEHIISWFCQSNMSKQKCQNCHDMMRIMCKIVTTWNHNECW